MTMVNGVGFSKANSGIMQLDGTNDYIVLNSFNISTTNHTIIGASRYSGATRGRIFSTLSGNWLLGHWNGFIRSYYPNGDVRLAVDAGNTNWYVSTAVENYSSDLWTLYSNGSQLITNTNGSAGPNGLSFGCWAANSEFSTAEISFFMVYNRLLTTEEINQNYNALKGRFNL